MNKCNWVPQRYHQAACKPVARDGAANIWFNDENGGPTEKPNDGGIKYCPWCGGEITVVEVA